MTKKLTPEELRLWQLNTKDVKLLSKEREWSCDSVAEHIAPLKNTIAKEPLRNLEHPLESVVLPPLGRKALRRLKIEARFDMHGLTLVKGYDALEQFLRRAQDKGFKTLLIITGKGSLTAENTLRRQLPRWLAETPLRQLVSSLHHPARLQDGGTGAFYVEVRRRDKPRL